MASKGKYAIATERRRFAWSRVIWPLVLELGAQAFTAAQYREKRRAVCAPGAETLMAARGLASLTQKGVILREGEIYSIHYRLMPYMRMRAECDYATAVRESSAG